MGVVRKREWLFQALFWVFVALMAWMAWRVRGNLPAMAYRWSILGPLAFGCYLMAWEFEIVVTPQEVRLYTPFKVKSVPRFLLKSVKRKDHELRLGLVAGRNEVTYSAKTWPPLASEPERMLVRLREQLTGIPAEGVDPKSAEGQAGKVEVRGRNVLIGLACLAALSVIVFFVAS